MIVQKKVSIEKCRHWEDLQNETYKINISLYVDLQMNKNHQNMLFILMIFQNIVYQKIAVYNFSDSNTIKNSLEL
jgi:hypothetical protein